MEWFEKLDEKIREFLPDLRVAKDEPMSRHTSFHIGGPAKRMAFPTSAEQVVLLVHFAGECGVQPLVVGNGTNLLVADEGIDRLVINTSGGLTGLSCSDGNITAESGVSLAKLADFARKNGLSGLEFAHGIPGTVGGGVCMNAGAYGGEIRQVLVSAEILDPGQGVHTYSGSEMEFSYRHSILSDHPDWVVLRAVFQLRPGDPSEIRTAMEELMARRRASQPLEYPSAGSTFKRPEGYYAGTLIDGCGLKGLRIGGAQVSTKHAGFVINCGGASFQDVAALIEEVQRQVEKQKGVRLEPEVLIIR